MCAKLLTGTLCYRQKNPDFLLFFFLSEVSHRDGRVSQTVTHLVIVSQFKWKHYKCKCTHRRARIHTYTHSRPAEVPYFQPKSNKFHLRTFHLIRVLHGGKMSLVNSTSIILAPYCSVMLCMLSQFWLSLYWKSFAKAIMKEEDLANTFHTTISLMRFTVDHNGEKTRI